MRNKLTQKLSDINLDHRRIAKGMVVVSIFMLVGKFASAAKDAAIAYKFGVGHVVDIYSLSIVYSMWAPLVVSGVLNSICIPLIHTLKKSERDEFKNQLVGITLILAGAFTLILLYMLPLLLNRSLGNVPIGIQDSLSSFAQGFAPLAGLGILSALFSMILLSEERHANTLFESIPSTIVIMVLLLWPSSQAVDPLLWGSLVGFGLQSIGLYILLQRTGANVKPKIAFTSSGWLSLKRNFGIVVLGQFIMSWVDPVSFNIADTLGEGNVSALNYASKIIILFLSLGATAVARAILPVFSNSERENRNRIRLAIQWAGLSFAGGMFAAVLLWVLAEDIVRLVYERGAFSTSDTESIARAVKIGGLQLPFYFSGIVLAQLFVSFGNYKIILTSACVALFVKTVFSLLLVPSMAFTGIILAAVPMYFANNLLFLYKLYNMYKQDDFSHTYY